jgi:AraC-like DNA-binding protein
MPAGYRAKSEAKTRSPIKGFGPTQAGVRRPAAPRPGATDRTKYMQAHLDQELSLMALGTVVQMSPYYFSQLFKQSAGLSPHQYLLHQRVERAKHLLADPRRRIADVSQEVGIAAQSHVTTVFRTLLGTTPRTYQRQRGGEYKSGKIPQIPHDLKERSRACGIESSWDQVDSSSTRNPIPTARKARITIALGAAGLRVALSRRLRSEALSSGVLPAWASLMSRRSRSCRRGQPL